VPAAIVVEHLEPVLSPWVFLEYKHAASLVGGLLVTNVKDERERACLVPFAEAVEESIGELAGSEEILVLDPQAGEALSPEDFHRFKYVVVGGIMGDFPPRGRTRKLLTEKLGASARTLGSCQLSVDGAVYVAWRVARGEPLERLRVALGLTLKRGFLEVKLPYCYPVGEEGVVFSRELGAYLLTLLEEDEAYAAASGRIRSVADYGCRLEIPRVEYEVAAGRIVELGELLRGARSRLISER
jgi:ribosome biogenesis SPOUT family RNA methylase Rps3